MPPFPDFTNQPQTDFNYFVLTLTKGKNTTFTRMVALPVFSNFDVDLSDIIRDNINHLDPNMKEKWSIHAKQISGYQHDRMLQNEADGYKVFENIMNT